MDIFKKVYGYKDANFIRELGLYSFYKEIQGGEGPVVTYNGKKVVMIGSNNYLGLTHDPRVREAAIEAIKKYGTGCSGSRLLNGNLDLHMQLEHELAEFLGKQSAAFFSTGFFANQGTIECIAGKDDIIFSDSDNHASIISGCRLSRAQIQKYPHGDLNALSEMLSTSCESDDGRIIIADGVFSMTGDILDLPNIVNICEGTPGDKIRIMLDDAHAFGVIGKNGRGTADHFGLTDKVDLIMGTTSKSLASIGGFVAGDKDVIDYIKHASKSIIFTAAAPASATAATLKALEIIKTEPQHMENLWRNQRKMKKAFDEMGLDTLKSETPIIPIFVGDEGKALKLVVELFERGIYATTIVFPAVPYGNALIRTTFMANHNDEHLDYVINVFADLAKKYDLPKKDPNRVLKALSRNYKFNGVNKLDVMKAGIKSYIKSTANKFFNT